MKLSCPQCGKMLEAPYPLPSQAQCPFCSVVFTPTAPAPPPVVAPIYTLQPQYNTKVQGPAGALILIGVLNVTLALVSVVSDISWLVLNQGKPAAPQLKNAPFPLFAELLTPTPRRVMFDAVASVVRAGIGGVIICGAIKMRRLEAYSLAVSSSILSMLPCLTCCFCIGIPFGIWALVVLSRPEVRSSFH